jgi:hypothetical protein
MSVLYHVATGKGRFFRFAADKRAALASSEYVVQKPPGSSGRPGRPKRGEASPDAARLAEMASWCDLIARNRVITHEQACRLAREWDAARLPPKGYFW